MSSELEYPARFIGERVAEDEASAEGWRSRQWEHRGREIWMLLGGGRRLIAECWPPVGDEPSMAEHVARYDPARAQRRAAATRAIVAACTRAAEAGPDSPATILAIAVLDAMSTEWEHPGRPFVPDWTISPGALLVAEAVKARGWTPDDLAERSGLDAATVQGVLAGSARIDGPVAEGLARAIGTSAEMWLNAQRIYDAAILRGATDTSEEHGHE